jgi:hypothetical protein
MLSKSRGVITEMENIPSASGADSFYIIRYHTDLSDAGKILDAGSWIGFRYRDAHWSFLKQADF